MRPVTSVQTNFAELHGEGLRNILFNAIFLPMPEELYGLELLNWGDFLRDALDALIV